MLKAKEWLMPLMPNANFLLCMHTLSHGAILDTSMIVIRLILQVITSEHILRTMIKSLDKVTVQ